MEVLAKKHDYFLHYKGNMYRILDVGYLESTLESMVIYQSLNDSIVWIRNTKEFFSSVEVNGKSIPRFARCNKYGEVYEN